MKPAAFRERCLHRLGHWARDAFTLDTRGLAAFRIALGLILVADCLVRFRTFHLMFAADGVFPPDLLRRFQGTSAKWSLAFVSDAAWWGAAVLAAEGVAGAWLCTGRHSRAASVAAWVAAMSVMRRTEPANNAGDALLLCLLFWSMFLPLGAAWSLGGRGRRTPPPGRVCTVASAALVLQVAAVYLVAGMAKCNPTWFSGAAVSYALSIHDHGTALGMALSRVGWLTRPATWTVLTVELAGPLLLLLRPTAAVRTAVAATFILFHAVIWGTMWVGLFAPVGIAAWLAVVPAAAWDALTGTRAAAGHASSGRVASLACAVALVASAVACMQGACRAPGRPLPQPLRQAIMAAGLEQDWPMFGVIPQQEQWVYGEAELADGRVVDLLRHGRPLQRERPDGGFASLGTHRWHKLFWVLPRADCRVFAGPTAAALARDWNARHGTAEQVRSLQLRFAMRREADGDLATDDMLLASWPPRGAGGAGNFERFLDAVGIAPRRDPAPASRHVGPAATARDTRLGLGLD